MRIIIVGSTRYWSALERSYSKYLGLLGHRVALFPFPDLIYDYYSTTLFRRASYRFNVYIDNTIKKINASLYEYVIKNSPDIVWIFKGTDICPKILSKIKDAGILLVNYNADHPFLRTYRSSGGMEIERAIPYYDHHFSYSKEIIKEFKIRYNNSVSTSFLPFGYDLSDEEYNLIVNNSTMHREIMRICFIGSADNNLRYTTIKQVAQSGIPIDIYGSGWSRYLGRCKRNIELFNEVRMLDYWQILRKYRVQVNIFRPHNENSHNMRSFEIPCVGGIQLAPTSKEHSEFFTENKEILLYSTIDELITKGERLLSMDINEAMDIRTAARKKCISQPYSYKNRAALVEEIFLNLLNTR